MSERPHDQESSAAPAEPQYAAWLREGWRRTELLRARWSLIAALAALAIGAFVELTEELTEGELDAFDRAVLAQVIALRAPILNGPAVDLTALGSLTVLTLLVAGATLFLFLARDYRAVTQLLIVAIAGGMISSLLKRVIERARPDELSRLVEVSSYSYPSGHSFSSASIYLTLAIVLTSRMPTTFGRTLLIALALLLATTIGASRAYLGVHYPSDIAAGLLLGAGWALLVSALFSYAKLRRRRARAAAQDGASDASSNAS
jgi:undecaprenyl-diphosphatase